MYLLMVSALLIPIAALLMLGFMSGVTILAIRWDKKEQQKQSDRAKQWMQNEQKKITADEKEG